MNSKKRIKNCKINMIYLTVMFLGLKWPIQAKSTKAWSPKKYYMLHYLKN